MMQSAPDQSAHSVPGDHATPVGVRAVDRGLAVASANGPWRKFALALGAMIFPLAASSQNANPPAAKRAAAAAISPAAATVAAVKPDEPAVEAYQLAPGDVIKVLVFENPDLTLETRIGEDGTIHFPLIGAVPVAGAGLDAAEKRIARLLHDGKFVVAPQVTVSVVQVRGNMVTVLGQVAKPGRFPLETTDAKLTEVLALAGGISATGSDVVVLTGTRNGAPMRREIDIQNLSAAGNPASDIRLQAGDMLYVNRAPEFYIYGEVQRPGVYRLERGMMVMQALAAGGGLTPKGTQRGLRINRRGTDGKTQMIDTKLEDPLLPGDVVYVRESLF